MLVGTILYFVTGANNYSNSMSGTVLSSKELLLLKNTQIKVAYTPDEKIKLFAYANPKYFKGINFDEGKGLELEENYGASVGSIIIGNIETKMMRDERLFTNVGDNITELFGLDVQVLGVISKTDSFIDDFHFIDSNSFDKISAKNNVVIIRFKDSRTPKLFYLSNNSDLSNTRVYSEYLSEGVSDTTTVNIFGGKSYYPIILGSKETKMMRDEKLFKNIGDNIDNFFGKNVYISGILLETNTSIDMMHIVNNNFFDSNTVVESDNANVVLT
jgi:hypothetical protein